MIGYCFDEAYDRWNSRLECKREISVSEFNRLVAQTCERVVKTEGAAPTIEYTNEGLRLFADACLAAEQDSLGS